MCTLRLPHAKFEKLLFRYIIHQWGQIKESWGFRESYLDHSLCAFVLVCVFYESVVTEFKGSLDTVTSALCVPSFSHICPDSYRERQLLVFEWPFVNLETMKMFQRTGMIYGSILHIRNKDNTEVWGCLYSDTMSVTGQYGGEKFIKPKFCRRFVRPKKIYFKKYTFIALWTNERCIIHFLMSDRLLICSKERCSSEFSVDSKREFLVWVSISHSLCLTKSFVEGTCVIC